MSDALYFLPEAVAVDEKGRRLPLKGDMLRRTLEALHNLALPMSTRPEVRQRFRSGGSISAVTELARLGSEPRIMLLSLQVCAHNAPPHNGRAHRSAQFFAHESASSIRLLCTYAQYFFVCRGRDMRWDRAAQLLSRCFTDRFRVDPSMEGYHDGENQTFFAAECSGLDALLEIIKAPLTGTNAVNDDVRSAACTAAADAMFKCAQNRDSAVGAGFIPALTRLITSSRCGAVTQGAAARCLSVMDSEEQVNSLIVDKTYPFVISLLASVHPTAKIGGLLALSSASKHKMSDAVIEVLFLSIPPNHTLFHTPHRRISVPVLCGLPHPCLWSRNLGYFRQSRPSWRSHRAPCAQQRFAPSPRCCRSNPKHANNLLCAPSSLECDMCEAMCEAMCEVSTLTHIVTTILRDPVL